MMSLAVCVLVSSSYPCIVREKCLGRCVRCPASCNASVDLRLTWDAGEPCRHGHCVLVSCHSSALEKENSNTALDSLFGKIVMLGDSQARPLRDQHAEVADGSVLSRSEDQCCGLLSVSEYGVVGLGLEWTTIPHLPLESEEDQIASRES